MNLKIDVVKGHGDASEERVLLTVTGDTNLRHYMISDATYAGVDKISNKHRHSKWFVSKDVKQNDRVILYTRSGTDETVKATDGVTWHKVYWGLKTPVWNDDGDVAVLIHIRSTQFVKAK